MRKLLLLALVLTLGCFKPRTRYFVACDLGTPVINVVEATDSADATDLFRAAMESGLVKSCRIYRVN